MNSLLFVLYLFGAQFFPSEQSNSKRSVESSKDYSRSLQTTDASIMTDSLAWKVGDRGIIQGTRIAVDDKENIYVAGDYRGTVQFLERTFISKGNSDPFLAKISQ